MHWCSPKVVEKNVGERSVWPQVSIVFDSTDIIKDEPAIATVMVTDDTREHHHGPQSMLQSHLGHTNKKTLPFW